MVYVELMELYTLSRC